MRVGMPIEIRMHTHCMVSIQFRRAIDSPSIISIQRFFDRFIKTPTYEVASITP